jgi:hypothetical protein
MKILATHYTAVVLHIPIFLYACRHLAVLSFHLTSWICVHEQGKDISETGRRGP